MATTAPVQTHWRDEWFEFEDATYLNTADAKGVGAYRASRD